jgi:hypothetical protein
MSMNQFEPGPGGQPAPKQGMGTGCKVMLILSIIFGVLSVICCGGFIWWIVTIMNQAQITEPDQIVEITDEITEISIPQSLQPMVGSDVGFAGQMIFTGAAYGDPASNSRLILSVPGEGQNEAQFRVLIEQKLTERGMSMEDLTPEDVRHRVVDVGGRPVTFTIEKGPGVLSQSPRLRVSAEFPGKRGTVTMEMNVDANTVSEQEVIEMIESIR